MWNEDIEISFFSGDFFRSMEYIISVKASSQSPSVKSKGCGNNVLNWVTVLLGKDYSSDK
jgi:hypothetical protein